MDKLWDRTRLLKEGKELSAFLEKAKEAGLLSDGEYLTKKANLYNEYARIPSSQIKDLLIGKLAS